MPPVLKIKAPPPWEKGKKKKPEKITRRTRDIQKMVEEEVGKAPKDIEDRLLWELASEIDFLRDVEKESTSKPDAAANVALRRIQAIKALEDAVQRKKERVRSERVEIVAESALVFKRCLEELGKGTDEVELIMASVVPKLEELTLDVKK